MGELSDRRVVTFPDLKGIYGIPWTAKHVNDLITRGEFPQPFKLGPQTNAWWASDIERFLLERSQEPAKDPAISARCSRAGTKGMARRWGLPSKRERILEMFDAGERDAAVIAQACGSTPTTVRIYVNRSGRSFREPSHETA